MTAEKIIKIADASSLNRCRERRITREQRSSSAATHLVYKLFLRVLITHVRLRCNPQVIMVRYKLIATFRGQDVGSDDNPCRTKDPNTPADRAKDPRLVKSPANEEPVLVVEQVCLRKDPVISNEVGSSRRGTQVGRTTTDMPAACTTAERRISKLRMLHPFSRALFPPDRITRYATTLMPCSTTNGSATTNRK